MLVNQLLFTHPHTWNHALPGTLCAWFLCLKFLPTGFRKVKSWIEFYRKLKDHLNLKFLSNVWLSESGNTVRESPKGLSYSFKCWHVMQSWQNQGINILWSYCSCTDFVRHFPFVPFLVLFFCRTQFKITCGLHVSLYLPASNLSLSCPLWPR